MRTVLWTIFELAINLFQGFMYMYLIFGVLEYKKTKIPRIVPYTIGSFSIFALMTFFNYTVYFEGIGALGYSLITLCIEIVYFKGSFLKKIVVSIIPTTCMIIIASFINNLISYFFKQDLLYLITQKSIYRLLMVILNNLLLFIIISVVRNFFKKDDVRLSKLEWLLFLCVFFISIVILMLLHFAIFDDMNQESILYIFTSIVLIALINLIIFFLLEQLSRKHRIMTENSLLRQEHSFQSKLTQQVREQYDNIKKTRHDFKNILTIIQTLNQENNREKIDEYISQYIKQQIHSVRIINTDNDYLDAIINVKIALASNFDIDVNTNIFSNLNITDSFDLCKIIGNMFDNAIEACKKCDDNRTIYFEISRDEASISVLLKNSIEHSVLSDNPNLITDKGDSANHGFGTKIIKDLAEKHGGFADFYEEGSLFCCNVEVLAE